MIEKREFPEPVPAASQLAVLPFLAAVDGILKNPAGKAKTRITMHRVMAREGIGYLQQLCTYFGSIEFSQENSVGRIFPVNTGIMGKAFSTKKVLRTRFYSSREQACLDLAADLRDNGDKRPISQVPISYLAVPFLGPAKKVVLTLYVECDILNIFSDDVRVCQIVDMCHAFCRLFDWLSSNLPFPTLHNFPLELEAFKFEKSTVFRRLQEEFDCQVPRFKHISYFNYDAAVG